MYTALLVYMLYHYVVILEKDQFPPFCLIILFIIRCVRVFVTVKEMSSILQSFS